MRNALPDEGLAPVGVAGTGEHGMIRSMIRGLVAVGFASFLILITLPLATRIAGSKSLSRAAWWAFLLKGALLLGAAVVAATGLYYLLKKLEPFLDCDALLEARFLDTSDPKYVDVAILSSAALSVFLELALIRRQSSVLEFLAFYKNFSLLRALPDWDSDTPSPTAAASRLC